MNDYNAKGFSELVQIVARLRAPDGCPWDKEQTHASVARNVTEEAAEVVDAIEQNDLPGLVEELGDLLLQVVLQAQIAKDEGEFELDDVICGISEKLVRRHPHVFGTSAALDAARLDPEQRLAFEQRIAEAKSPEAVLGLWDQIKLLEREQKAGRRAAALVADSGIPNGTVTAPAAFATSSGAAGFATSDPVSGLLDSVPTALPALMQAQDISRKAISAGFDWQGLDGVWDQVFSEIKEYRQESLGSSHAAEEFGDLLFSLVNVARREGIDAESALRSSCRKFRSRWAIMERCAAEQGKDTLSCSTEELELLWQQAKAELHEAKASAEGT
ncbi:MAG: nucleoside triphosphate pyrophosphohydrolase [Actinomycetia bacterium]|nr:nucleoside triphosphate pyrophosphohydrolase [Actinomycetes bacterium]